MERHSIPNSADDFANILCALHTTRRQRQEASRTANFAREILSASERREIFAKTAGRCHICGGKIDGAWQADHVLAHSSGGGHAADNYLPAHSLCNNYRWDYSSEEFQHILKLGVWIRTQIERKTQIGRAVAVGYLAYERARVKRHRSTSKGQTDTQSNHE